MQGLPHARRVAAGRDQGPDDEVDGDDVERGRLCGELRHREPQPVGARDGSQDVVGPVELLGLAAVRVPDHDRGAVDGHGKAIHQGADPHLGLELRRLVVVLEALAEGQLVLVHDAFSKACDVRGAHVVQALEAFAALAELEQVGRALDVDLLRGLERYREVVDRRQVEHPGGLRRQPLVGPVVEAEPYLGDVARNDLYPRLVDIASDGARPLGHPLLDESGDPSLRPCLEQGRHEPLADEAGEAGDQEEAGHQAISGRRGSGAAGGARR